MKPNSIIYCSICGSDYKFKEFCCDFPKVLSKKKWKKKFSSKEDYEEDFIKKVIKFCVWCGVKVKWNEYGFEKDCFNCNKNVRGGRYFRKDESLSYCENCGNKVYSRDTKCSCGYLPLQEDNKLLEIQNELIYPFEKNYCKDCGKDYEEISDLKEDVVNEKTGEVTTEIPHFCNLNSPFYP